MYHWCWALINNRLAEVHFDKTKSGRPKIFGHCYVKRNEYKTKREQRQIDIDIKKVKLTYRNKRYYDKHGLLESIRP